MHNSGTFKRLFEPGNIAQMKLENRIIMPAMLTNYSTSGGYVSERMKGYYESRSMGGTGLIIVEPSFVHIRGRIRECQIGIHDDKYLAGLSELAASIHKHGAKAAIQLNHGGRRSPSAVSGLQPLAPSPIPATGMEMPREAKQDDINEVIDCFVAAAKRAHQAGFDAIEISATTAALIGQFLSLASNCRQDQYGGDLEKRARLLGEVIGAVKNAMGAGYPVWCRVNGMEEASVEHGLTIDEAKSIALIAQKAGADAIHVYVDYDGAPTPIAERPLRDPRLIYLAAGIKSILDVPVIAVGHISPDAGEKALRDHKADFIAIGKALIADPELPHKALQGRLSSIRPCITCLACIDTVRAGGPMECSVNARAGRELEWIEKPTERRKKVFVAGGGPAGMEAACVAASRGHEVTLYEKTGRLGGALVLAAVLNPALIELRTHLIRELEKMKVGVKTKTELSSAIVEEEKPDEIILAVGGSPVPLQVPGADGDNVVTISDILNVLEGHIPGRSKGLARGLWAIGSALLRYAYLPPLIRWFLRFPFPIRKHAVLIGGGLAGCELGIALAESGKKVTIVEKSGTLLSDTGLTMKAIFLAQMKKHAIRVETADKVLRIDNQGIVVIEKNDLQKRLDADTVVLTLGLKANEHLAERFNQASPNIHFIGDCAEPGRVRQAIASGFQTGISL
jgi:2,4-dienoyl-CoA reductase-like NADH-dependent reductase (Old Yellow Enzyme family)/thioredoxin reductase